MIGLTGGGVAGGVSLILALSGTPPNLGVIDRRSGLEDKLCLCADPRVCSSQASCIPSTGTDEIWN